MIVSGLKSRETYGRIWRSDDIATTAFPIRYPYLWTTDSLASCAAWNPRRLQNMILSVGPGTPASLVFTSMGEKDDSSELSQSITIIDRDQDEGDEEESQGNSLFIELSHPAFFRLTESLGRVEENDDEEEGDDDDDDDDDSTDGNWEGSSSHSLKGKSITSNESDVGRMKRLRRDHSGDSKSGYSNTVDSGSIAESLVQGSRTIDAPPTALRNVSRHSRTLPNRTKLNDCASMKHDGCINAAVWLPTSWRFSLAHTSDTFQNSESLIFSSSFSSNTGGGCKLSEHQYHFLDDEYPTQIATSGDDRQVKFWDVSHSMGLVSPETCFTPFSSLYPENGVESSVIKNWRKKYRHGSLLPGLVHPLSSIKTGHRGNVFHLTPIRENPGKVVTCGADGYLLLSDVCLQSSTSSSWTASTVIVSPRQHDDMRNSLLGIGEMCYSHVMIDANTGLLCGNEGLHQFDLRLPSQSQPPRSILGNSPCKCCALWSVSDTFRQIYMTDSIYVFAGGSGPTVNLYDLRYVTGTKVIESYTPSKLQDCVHVSVSGIDVSRDKQELLISYENDVIYTFPILPGVKSPAGPLIDEMNERDHSSNPICVNETASYGAHLNRLTFLKCARYAGPTDEYICTGSDSGHAWIYDKANGTVVSLLKADQTTCNGIVPHPIFPFFLTYGIDSTAKLWRATIPVSNDIDDSAMGRCNHLHHRKYGKSSVINDWKEAKANVSLCYDFEEKNFQIFADDFPAHEAVSESDFSFGSFSRFILRALSNENKCFKIRNDLHNLPLLVSQNLSTCIRLRAHHEDDDIPIQSSLSDLKQRISLIRIHHQLDELGHSSEPCTNDLIFLINEAKKHGFHMYDSTNAVEMMSTCTLLPDLIPDHLSDWFPYDPKFSTQPSTFGIQLNKEVYNCRRWKPSQTLRSSRSLETCSSSNSVSQLSDQDCFCVLSNIVLLLKDYGNTALKQGLVNLAAKYYDKSIRCCSLLYMPCEHGSCEFLGEYQSVILSNGGYYTKWTTLFKSFLSIRLNLSAVMMKSEISEYDCASQQAQLVIDALKPFATIEGKVLSGPKLESFLADEPVETFIEANAMKAKAYFRLGNAKLLKDDYSAAVRSFEGSIKATKAAHLEPENIVVRRLNEARLAKARKSTS